MSFSITAEVMQSAKWTRHGMDSDFIWVTLQTSDFVVWCSHQDPPNGSATAVLQHMQQIVLPERGQWTSFLPTDTFLKRESEWKISFNEAVEIILEQRSRLAIRFLVIFGVLRHCWNADCDRNYQNGKMIKIRSLGMVSWVTDSWWEYSVPTCVMCCVMVNQNM